MKNNTITKSIPSDKSSKENNILSHRENISKFQIGESSSKSFNYIKNFSSYDSQNNTQKSIHMLNNLFNEQSLRTSNGQAYKL
jgi:hypothetical protein